MENLLGADPTVISDDEIGEIPKVTEEEDLKEKGMPDNKGARKQTAR